MFVSKDKASSYFKDKFEGIYNQLKSEDASCFEEAEFFFDLSLIYIIDGNQDELIFGLHNRGVQDNCQGMYGESTFLMPFEDIIPLIKL